MRSEWDKLSAGRQFFRYSIEELDEMIAQSLADLDEIENGPLPECEEDAECEDQSCEISSWCISECRKEKRIRAELSAHERMRQEMVRRNGPTQDTVQELIEF
jgi:hypothetical protein